MSTRHIRRSAAVVATAFALPVALGIAAPAFAGSQQADPYGLFLIPQPHWLDL